MPQLPLSYEGSRNDILNCRFVSSRNEIRTLRAKALCKDHNLALKARPYVLPWYSFSISYVSLYLEARFCFSIRKECGFGPLVFPVSPAIPIDDSHGDAE